MRNLFASLAFAALACATPAYSQSEITWGLEMIGIDAVIEAGFSGRGIKVGVVDTGLDLTHPEFAGRIDPNNLDLFALLPVVGDHAGHGTHVAGIIGAARDGVGMHGVAFESIIVPYVILPPVFDPAIGAHAMTRLIDHAIANDVGILNGSFGYPYPLPDKDTIDNVLFRDIAALRKARDNDIIFVFSTGNDSFASPGVWAGVPELYPDLASTMLSVTAVGPDGELAWYSNACGNVMYSCITAPGGDGGRGHPDAVYSTWVGGGYEYENGTSMAAPFVTGSLVIAKEIFPNVSNQDLGRLLRETSTDIGAPGVDSTFGWGLLNLRNVVAAQANDPGAFYGKIARSHAHTIDSLIDTLSNRPMYVVPQSVRNANPLNHPTGLTAWAMPFGGFSNFGDGSRGNLAGLAIGSDVYTTDFMRVGVSAALNASSMQARDGAFTNQSYHIAGYADLKTPELVAGLTIGASGFDVSATRYLPGMAGTVLGNRADAHFWDTGIWTAAKFGLNNDLGGFNVQPYVHARAISQGLGSAVENNPSMMAGSIAAYSQGSVVIGPGLRVEAPAVSFGEIQMTASADVSYGRYVVDDATTRTSTTVLNGTTTSGPAALSADSFSIDLELRFNSPTVPIDGYVAYAGDFRGVQDAHAFKAGIGVKF